jgi:hypothetical protein
MRMRRMRRPAASSGRNGCVKGPLASRQRQRNFRTVRHGRAGAGAGAGLTFALPQARFSIERQARTMEEETRYRQGALAGVLCPTRFEPSDTGLWDQVGVGVQIGTMRCAPPLVGESRKELAGYGLAFVAPGLHYHKARRRHHGCCCCTCIHACMSRHPCTGGVGGTWSPATTDRPGLG